MSPPRRAAPKSDVTARAPGPPPGPRHRARQAGAVRAADPRVSHVGALDGARGLISGSLEANWRPLSRPADWWHGDRLLAFRLHPGRVSAERAQKEQAQLMVWAGWRGPGEI